MKTFPHVIGRIFDKPLMIVPAKAEAIVAALGPALHVAALPRNDVPSYLPDSQARRWFDGRVRGEKRSDDFYAVTEAGIACISVEGILAHTSATASPPSGMQCYGEIEVQIERAVRDATIRGILLDIDSPGGEASDSAFALAERIRAARTVKPVWAVADEMACSAAYLLASAAGQFFVPQGGYAGSIGVYALHLDQSGYDKKEGLAWTYVYAGPHKIDGNQHAPLADDVRAEIQADVNKSYERFVEAVGAGRPKLGAGGARKTEARVFRGADAVKLGIADKVLDFHGALQLMTSTLAGSSSSYQVPPSAPLAISHSAPVAACTEAEIVAQQADAAAAHDDEDHMSTEKNQGQAAPTTAATTTQPAAASAAVPAAPVASAAAPAATPAASGNVVDINAARSEGMQQAATIAQLCQIAGHPSLAADFIAKGMTEAQVRQALLERQAASAEASSVGTGITAAAGTKANTGGLLAACKALAEKTPKKSS